MDSRKNVKNEEVSRELLDEQSPELLKELHLLTRSGDLNADARRKLKQVNHLYNLIKPALDDLLQRFDDVTILDVGAGKAYLGFILYELALKNREKGSIVNVVSREDLILKGKETSERLGFSRMSFVKSTMDEFRHQGPIHFLTALHACDTATDDALLTGIRSEVDTIAVVPCCQAEVAQLLKQTKPPGISELWRHGIHRREFGSHITNVLRSLVLEAHGYQVTVTELVGWEHSLKNEFILARRIQKKNALAEKHLREILEQIQVRPKIVRELYP